MSEFRIVDRDDNTLSPGPLRVIRDEWVKDDMGRTVRRILEAITVDGTTVSGEIVYDETYEPGYGGSA